MTQPPRSNCMLMPAMPRTVGHARRYARWLLGTWRLEPTADTIELPVSELVTDPIDATGVAYVHFLAGSPLIRGGSDRRTDHGHPRGRGRNVVMFGGLSLSKASR